MLTANNNIVIALPNQNIWDIVLQEYGTIEAAFEFMALNNIDGLDAKLTVGKKYKVSATSITQQATIKNYYAKNKIKVTTGYQPVTAGILLENGQNILLENGQGLKLEITDPILTEDNKKILLENGEELKLEN